MCHFHRHSRQLGWLPSPPPFIVKAYGKNGGTDRQRSEGTELEASAESVISAMIISGNS